MSWISTGPWPEFLGGPHRTGAQNLPQQQQQQQPKKDAGKGKAVAGKPATAASESSPNQGESSSTVSVTVNAEGKILLFPDGMLPHRQSSIPLCSPI